MKLRPDEITKVLREQIEQFSGTVDVEEVGTVLQVGDGIARIHGLDSCVALEMVELPHDVDGPRAEPRGGQRRRRAPRRGRPHQGGRPGPPHRQGHPGARSGEALLGRVVDPLGNPLDDRGPIETDEFRPVEFKAPGVVAAPAGEGAAPDRHQGHRRAHPDRPRPARADHRRPPDRQDDDRGRHDHQPGRPGRALLLRRHRPEGLHRRDRGRAAARRRRHGVHDRRRRHRRRRRRR